MHIREFEKDKWIFLNDNINFNELYGEEYEKRVGSNYYNPEVLEKRKKFIERFANLNECFDFGCGRQPVAENEKLSNYDPYVKKFSIFDMDKFMIAKCILLFDVLEHFFDLKTVLTIIPQKTLMATIPIVPNNILENLEQIKNWKHFKPGEHFYYFTENGFIEYIESCGWKLVYKGYDECPPRSDIGSFVFERV